MSWRFGFKVDRVEGGKAYLYTAISQKKADLAVPAELLPEYAGLQGVWGVISDELLDQIRMSDEVIYLDELPFEEMKPYIPEDIALRTESELLDALDELLGGGRRKHGSKDLSDFQ